MKATLPELNYKYSALEPYIDALTMEIHHAKHHQAYVDNFNKAIEGLELKYDTYEEILKNIKGIPADKRQAVINNGGGHANHSFFWKIMTPGGIKETGKLVELLKSKFGTLNDFKQKFSEKSLNLFGSGWVFLQINKSGQLELKRHSFQNSPLLHGNMPILGIDLWEHAYYLKYQNKRADYISAWWNVVNWKEVENNFNKAIK